MELIECKFMLDFFFFGGGAAGGGGSNETDAFQLSLKYKMLNLNICALTNQSFEDT